MKTAEKKMMTVTARQINTVANEIKTLYPILSKSYAEKAIDVAVNYRGSIEIPANNPLAVEIRELKFSTLD